MQQIADWLEKLGMSEYAERFAENRIDFSVLRDLTDQDLKDSASSSVIAARCCAQLANLPLRRRHRRNLPPQRRQNPKKLRSVVRSR
jgi:hypothetical protein